MSQATRISCGFRGLIAGNISVPPPPGPRISQASCRCPTVGVTRSATRASEYVRITLALYRKGARNATLVPGRLGSAHAVRTVNWARNTPTVHGLLDEVQDCADSGQWVLSYETTQRYEAISVAVVDGYLFRCLQEAGWAPLDAFHSCSMDAYAVLHGLQ
jgi:hypothetical protein